MNRLDIKNDLAERLAHALFDSDSSFSSVDDVSFFKREQCCEKVRDYLVWLNELNVHSVMLVTSPSIDALCLCYALVLSNKTYIPVHTSTSSELLNVYIQTYQVDLVVVQPQLIHKFDVHLQATLVVDKRRGFFYYAPQQPENFCLLPGIILFTSGTSDQPKAVYYSYERLSRYISWCLGEFNLRRDDCFLFTTELSFVASLRPLFVPVLAGAMLHFPGSYTTNKLQLILNALLSHKITILNLTPTLFKIMVQHGETNSMQDALLSIRLILLSGEPLDVNVVNYWLEHINKNTLFYSLYGATEYLVPFYKKINTPLHERERLHLGQLRTGCDYKLIPATTIGYELYIAGEIATAYFDKELTQSNYRVFEHRRFIKTQDFVTRHNNELYFCSRHHRIVKKYGQLINLDQIEYVLKKNHKRINFITFFDENTHKIYLIIHGSLRDDLLLNQILHDLNEHLPGYMHPDEFIFTPEIPLTPSGKIDYLLIKKNLVLPEEHELMNYFQRFFPDKAIDVTVKIIDLGFESIDYIEMAEAFLKRTGKWLDIAKINEETRIANIRSCLSEYKLQRSHLNEVVSLNSIQAAFYAKELQGNDKVKACIVASFCLKGPLDIPRLETAIAETLGNHFMLTSRLERIDNNYYFVSATNIQTEFKLRNPIFFRKKTMDRLKTSVHAECLVRIFIQKRNQHYFLLMAYHHIALDGWSAVLVREELFRRYEGTYATVPLKREDEIDYLNQANQILTPNHSALNELTVRLSGINVADYNQLDSLFNGALYKNHTSFSLEQSKVERFAQLHHINSSPYSVIFALLLHQAIARQAGSNKLFFYTSFSNRNLPVPGIQELITNIATGLPIFLDDTKLTLNQFALQIQETLTAYFKNMNYGSLMEIWEKELIDRTVLISREQPYILLYTYINKITDTQYIQDNYIDWSKSTNEIDEPKSKGFIFLRVYNMGSHFVVIFDSFLKKQMHERLLKNLCEHF